MAGKRRSINRKLAQYVYCRTVNGKDYYYYEHPLMKAKGVRPESFGSNWQEANEVARCANAKFSTQRDRLENLVTKVDPGTPVVKLSVEQSRKKTERLNATMGDVVSRFKNESEQYQDWIATKGTWKDKKNHFTILQEKEGHNIFSQLDTATCLEIIREHRSGDGRRKLKDTMSGIFKWAINEGYHTTNVAKEITLDRNSKHTIRKRKRMSIKDYATISDAAQAQNFHWFADAMEIALITAQGRAEVVSWTYKDNIVKQDGKEFLKFERQKTKNKSGGSWQLVEIGDDLKKCIHRCRVRSMRLGCPYIVAVDTKPLRPSKEKTHRSQCLPQFLTDTMSRITSDLNVDGAVFHEIRSLACRLYFKEHGFEWVANLTNHATAKETEEYLKDDSVVYREGVADLPIKLISNVKPA